MVFRDIIFAILLSLAVAEDDFASRIVDGDDASMGEFPWVVWLGKDNQLVCHGALVRENLVLTTKTCSKQLDKLSNAYAYIGDRKRYENDAENPSQKIEIKKANRVIVDNVAILKLESMADISKNEVKNVNVIQTASGSDEKKILSSNPKCYIAGWGRKAKDNGKSLVDAPKLQKLKVKFTKSSRCKKIKGFDRKRDLCYKAKNKEGPCDFDEGTPITCKYKNDWIVVAVEAGKRTKQSNNRNRKCRGGYVAPVKIAEYYADIQKRLDNVFGDVSTANHPSDCTDAQNQGLCTDGGPCQLSLKMSYGYKDYTAVCDQDTDGGGWTIIQRRLDGSVDFYKRFFDYEYGFGSKESNKEYWLGLKWIRALTEAGNTEMRIDLTNENDTTAYQVFQDFLIGRARGYMLNVGSSNGTAGDQGGFSMDDGSLFSTFDNEQMDDELAKLFHTGWWVPNQSGSFVNLNGKYGTPGTINLPVPPAGFTHIPFNDLKMLKESKMMIRVPKLLEQ